MLNAITHTNAEKRLRIVRATERKHNVWTIEGAGNNVGMEKEKKGDEKKKMENEGAVKTEDDNKTDGTRDDSGVGGDAHKDKVCV